MGKIRLRVLLCGALTAAAPLGGACGGCGEEEAEQVCISGITNTCSCPGELVGTQVCKDDGTGYGRCLCPTSDAALPDRAGLDLGRPDVGQPDTSGPDTDWPDTNPPDTAQPDAAQPDTAQPDAGAADVLGVDLTAIDSAASDAHAVDAGQPDAAQADTAAPDTGPADAGSPDLAQPDTAATDAGAGVDATAPFDAAGMAGLGESCNAIPCTPPLLCTGSGDFYCRVRCTLGGSDCDPAIESCVNVVTVDGGSCVPGNAPPAACGVTDPPCADLYVCLAPGATSDFHCSYRCDPSATDAGCPSGACVSIIGQDGGGCI